LLIKALANFKHLPSTRHSPPPSNLRLSINGVKCILINATPDEDDTTAGTQTENSVENITCESISKPKGLVD
jgi:hypothetical protein